MIHAAFERLERLFERANGAGGIGFGDIETMGQLRHHLVDQALRRPVRIAQFHLRQAMRQANHILANARQAVTRTRLTFIKLIGQLAERALDGTHRFLRLRRRQILLDFGRAFTRFADMPGESFQALGLGVDQALGLFQPTGEQAMVFFGTIETLERRFNRFGLLIDPVLHFCMRRFITLQPAQHGFDGMGHPAHSGSGPRFGSLHARTKRFQGTGNTAEIAGSGLIARFLGGIAIIMGRALIKDRLATQITRTEGTRRRRIGRGRLMRCTGHAPSRFGFITIDRTFGAGAFAADQGPDILAFEDHLVQPLTEGHAGPARQILGDFSRPGINTLHTPRCVRAHAIPLTSSGGERRQHYVGCKHLVNHYIWRYVNLLGKTGRPNIPDAGNATVGLKSAIKTLATLPMRPFRDICGGWN